MCWSLPETLARTIAYRKKLTRRNSCTFEVSSLSVTSFAIDQNYYSEIESSELLVYELVDLERTYGDV